jgi:hypothetical protein
VGERRPPVAGQERNARGQATTATVAHDRDAARIDPELRVLVEPAQRL